MNERTKGFFPIVVYHNAQCGTSRKVLALIESARFQPTVIEYLKAGWSVGPLQGLFAAAGLTARQSLRDSKSPAGELGLLEPGVTEDQLLEAMVAHPILVNRPIVATPKGVCLCRPSELVLGLL